MIVCLNDAGEGRYEVIDCDTGQPIELDTGKVKKKRTPSAYNLCVKDAFKNNGAKNLKEAARMCKINK